MFMCSIIAGSCNSESVADVSLFCVAARMADPFDRDDHPSATTHPRRTNKFQFKVNFLGQGESVICAAGILPLLVAKDGTLRVLLQEEDMPINNSYPKLFKPALAPFGGVVERKDTHWVHTAGRELDEETGGLLPRDVLEHVMNFSSQMHLNDSPLLTAHIGDPTFFQVLFYPIPAMHKQPWLSLPGEYERTFRGVVDANNWSRSATKLHWVPLSRGFGLEQVVHECSSDDPEQCARRCNQKRCAFRGRNLCLKVQLHHALYFAPQIHGASCACSS